MTASRRSAPIVPIVLAGGAGTRLWPLSRPAKPKPYLPLIATRSLLQATVQRAAGLGSSVRPPVLVCDEAHRFLVAEQLRAVHIQPQAIVLEPARRNTAPAVAVAAMLARRLEAKNPSGQAEPLLLVLPADHVLTDPEGLAAAVKTAMEPAAAGRLVTFGVVPERPETGYGYILSGEDRGGWFELERFVEKPDLETAESYLESGRYLWNSGMFLFGAGAFLRELAAHAPDMARGCERAVAAAAADGDFTRLGNEFLSCPSSSIDYAVMEKTRKAAVVPLRAGWSDVGSWPALFDVLPKDADGNVTVGDAIAERCTNSYVASTSARSVVAIGLEGVIVVETEDAVLVMAREHAAHLKRVVDSLNARPQSPPPPGESEGDV